MSDEPAPISVAIEVDDPALADRLASLLGDVRGLALAAPGQAATVTITARTTPSHDPSELTPRELDVLTLIGKGFSNNEIADELCISGVTVKSHIGRIFGKLDLRDRAAAIVYAYDNGIVAPR